MCVSCHLSLPTGTEQAAQIQAAAPQAVAPPRPPPPPQPHASGFTSAVLALVGMTDTQVSKKLHQVVSKQPKQGRKIQLHTRTEVLKR